ncbi:MAG: hypothetical protein JSU04_05230 [Bdellovibrionales bacterium]|nr:hypothetical protein [Bdellovibrionales bacterium]
MLRHLFAAAFVAGSFFNFASAAPMAEPTESVLSGYNAQGEKVFLIRYQEDRLWRVEEIVQHADGWQDLISRKYYSYRSEAEKAQYQLQTHFSQVQTVNPLLQTESNEMVLQGGSIWPTTQAWNWDWEKKYAQWLTENMNTDFYQKYKIATDCADVAYSARWIFARINGLPAANRISGSGVLMTNQSMRPEWQNLPTAKNWYEDKRFRAALNYLLDMTYTHVLMRDSYPIAITPDNFMPGVHHLDLREVSGHTQLVHRVDLSDTAFVPYLIIQSTTPRKVRTLSESLSWGSEQAKKGQNGFLRILWPKVKNGTYALEKPENMPGYSLEQYAPDFITEKDRPNFLEVLLRLKPNLNFVTLVKSGYDDLKDMFKNRVGIVEEGYSHCPNRSCASDGQLYDDWSTPSRDKHITETIQQLEIFDYSPLPEKIRKDVQAAAALARDSVALSLDGDDYKLKTLIFAWKNKMFSSDPNDEPGMRWGMAPQYLSQKIQRDFAKVFAERKTKISAEADNSLRANLVLANSYCWNFSDAQCLQFKTQELTKSVSLNGQTRTLQEWLEYSLWLNSDPQQSPANQWGGLRATSKYQKIPGNTETFVVTKDGIGFMKTDKETFIGKMGVNGVENRALPAGFTWLTLARQSSVGWAYGAGSFLRQDFVAGTQTIYSVSGMADVTVVRAGSTHLMVESAGELWSLQVQGAQLVPVWHGAVSKGHMEGGDYYIAENAGGQWQIMDFTQPVPKIVAVAEDLSKAKIVKTTAKYIGVAADKKSIFYDRTTGAATDVTKLGLVSLWSDGLTKAVVWDLAANTSVIATLDAQFNIVSTQKLSQWTVTNGNYVIAMSMAAPPKIYQMKGEDFIEMPLRSDEEGYRDWSVPWVVTRLKTEGQYRLRMADGSKTLYEGGPLMLIGNQQTPEWVFSSKQGDSNLKLISLKNPKAGAYMTGEFFRMDGGMFVDNMNMGQVGADRGLILTYQGFNFWVEL